MTFTADALINKSLELVSPPTTYTQLDALIHDDNASADDIKPSHQYRSSTHNPPTQDRQ